MGKALSFNGINKSFSGGKAFNNGVNIFQRLALLGSSTTVKRVFCLD